MPASDKNDEKGGAEMQPLAAESTKVDVLPQQRRDVRSETDSVLRMSSDRKKKKRRKVDSERDEEGEEVKQREIRPVESFALMEADYGVLPEGDPADVFVQSRLRALLPGIPPEEFPTVHILASTGEGINACAFANWHIVITPELLRFAQSVEEVDYVLLHEINHLLSEDHAVMGRDTIRASFRRSLGAARVGEYRADILAFNQMAETERGTNSMGAISFLERLRNEKDASGWEPSHGTLTDRILNLKSITGLLELDHSQQSPFIHKLSQPPAPFPEGALQSLQKLPKGGYLSRLLLRPRINGQEWDVWQKETMELLRKSDEKLLKAVLPRLFAQTEQSLSLLKKSPGKGGAALSVQDIYHEGYQHLLRHALRRWAMLFEDSHTHLSRTERKMHKALVLESCLSIPVFSAQASPGTLDADAVKRKIAELQKEESRLSKHRSELYDVQYKNQDRAAIQKIEDQQISLGEKTRLLQCQRDEYAQKRKSADCVKEIPELQKIFRETEDAYSGQGAGALIGIADLLKKTGVPVGKGHMLKSCGDFAQAAIGEFALFDTDDGVDYESYLTSAADLLRHASTYESHYGYSDNSKKPLTLNDVWTDIVLHGACVLADIGALTSGYGDACKRVMEKTNAGEETLGFNSLRSEETLQKTTVFSLPVQEEVRTHMQEQWGISETMLSKIERLVCISAALHAEPVDIEQHAEHVRMLQEALTILDALPDHLHRETVQRLLPPDYLYQASSEQPYIKFDKQHVIDSYLEHALFDGGYVTVTNMEAAVRCAQVAAEDEGVYEDMLDEIADACWRKREKLTFPDMERLAHAASDLRAATHPLGKPRFSDTDIDIHRGVTWQENALTALAKTAQGISSAHEYFGILERYIQQWKIRFSEKILHESAEVKLRARAIAEKGITFIDIREPLSPVAQKQLLTVSFFLQDGTLARPLQEHVTSLLLADATFEESIDLVCHQFSAQGIVGGLDTLQLLEKKARTPEQLAALVQSLKESAGDELGMLTHVGEAVIVDGLMEAISQKANRLDFLLALLKSSKDEHDLKELLKDAWFVIYEYEAETDMDALSRAQSENDLDALVRAGPDSVFRANGLKQIIGYYSCSSLRDIVYRLGTAEKYGVLRKLLTGKHGALNSPEDRMTLIDQFLEMYLHNEGGSDTGIEIILRTVLTAIIQKAPVDELSIVLSPLLRTRIANPPPELSDWKPQAEEMSKGILDQFGSMPDWLYSKLENAQWAERTEKKKAYDGKDMQRKLNQEKQEDDEEADEDEVEWEIDPDDEAEESLMAAARKYYLPSATTLAEWMLSGYPSGQVEKSSVETVLSDLLPPKKMEKERSPMELILEMAQNFGAPGVRFLQLLGQAMPLTEEQREQFSGVYDAIEGQGKISAWETIKNVTPAFASVVREVGDRMGGGSLFTVYEILLENSTREACRVLNPNAWYHAQKFIHVIREALQDVAAKDPRYTQALPIIDLIEEWIREELSDETYDEDDAQFRKTWNTWKPSRSFKAHVVVPQSKSTGANKVRREEYIKGKDMTELSSFPLKQQKELVALAAQHYVAQVRGSLLSANTLVHSDISAGNLRVTSEGNLAILDRGMYLKFDMADRLFLKKLAGTGEAKARASVFTEWLQSMPENAERAKAVDPKTLAQDIMQLSEQRGGDTEELALDALIAARKHGFKIPLRFTLLFKNLNAMRQLAQQVGFSGLAAALEYQPK